MRRRRQHVVNGIDFEDTGGGTDATLNIRPVGVPC
jgi:hypothetical protein